MQLKPTLSIVRKRQAMFDIWLVMSCRKGNILARRIRSLLISKPEYWWSIEKMLSDPCW